jgi:hypothetical protein
MECFLFLTKTNIKKNIHIPITAKKLSVGESTKKVISELNIVIKEKV